MTNIQPSLTPSSYSRKSIDLSALSDLSGSSLEFASVSKTLADHPLFAGCADSFVHAVVDRARRFDLKADEDMDLKDGGPLCVVECGSIRLSVGAGPSVVAGPGTVLNCAGFLSVLGEAEDHRPRRFSMGPDVEAVTHQRQGSKSKSESTNDEVRPYKRTSNPAAPPPMLFVDDWKKKSAVANNSLGKRGNGLTEDELCFYNLCPHAAQVGKNTRKPTGWLPLKIMGAEAGAQPLEGDPCHNDKTREFGGARLVVIPYKLVLDIGKTEFESIYRIEENVARLKRLWTICLNRCSTIFVGVPPQLMWYITELIELVSVDVGDAIVTEGDVGDAAESVRILDEGKAVVEKLIGVSPSKVSNTVIASLGPGAIIGDMCLAGGTIPRPASVRATFPSQVIVLPVQRVLRLARFFPGMWACMGSRSRIIAGFLQTTLPLCSEALASVNLFAPCDEAFLRALSGDRRAFFGGHVFDEECDVKGMVYVVEYGRCGVEMTGRGLVTTIVPGKCFGVGEPPIIDTGEITHRDAFARVITPICITVQIPKKNMLDAFERFAVEKQRFERLKVHHNVSCKGGVNEKIDVFRDCGSKFVDTIFGALEMRCYLPGQTVVVMGSQDSSQMFILRSGHVALEKGGETVGEMHTGATFGELVMLGVVRRRTITVRAMTLCLTMEIPRATFLAGMETFPEERVRFEQLALKRMDLSSAIIWPILRGCPERMLLLLNLHAERRMCPVGDTSLATSVIKEAAILLLQGAASIVNPEGEEIESLSPGECFNEQILLGFPNAKNEHVVPKVLSEVQIVTQAAWEKVMEEFSEEQPNVKRNILKHMAGRSESRLGVTAGSTTMLKSSALFRGTSDSFVQALHGRLDNKLFQPGKYIIEVGKEGDGFYLLLDGIAEASLREMTYELSSGAFFGEAVLIGIVKAFQKTVRAKSLCIVQKLRKSDFKEVLAKHAGDQSYFKQAVLEAETAGHEELPLRVRQTISFESCHPEFLRFLCPQVDDAFFMPGETILQEGEEFVIGVSEIYLLLSGQAVVENKLGVTLGVVNPGEIFGEAALIGLASGRRSASVRAWCKGLVHCAKIPSRSMFEAFEKQPDQKDIFVNLGTQRFQRNQDLIERRTMWTNEVALPAMMKSYLFDGCDADQLRPIAATLAETTYAPGEVIARAGEQANTMIVLIEGVADVESKCGTSVGSFTGGAIIGEIAIMGIFSIRTSTVRAYQKCRVIHFAADVLMRTLQRLDDYILLSKIEDLGDSRLKQIRRGLPLSALSLGIPIDDLCVRAVGLQAHRIDLKTDECLDPVPDTSPCGPHFSVLVRGRLNVEMASNKDVVTTLTPGSLILEGLAADYCAHLRAKGHCELYRVRQSDFMIAVISVSSASEWFYRFRLLERETREHFHSRLRSARGAIKSLTRRPWRPMSPPQRGQRALENSASDGKLVKRPGTAPLMLKRDGEEDRTVIMDRPQRSVSLPVSVKPLDVSDEQSTTCATIDCSTPTSSCSRRRRLRSAVKADRCINGCQASHKKQRGVSAPNFRGSVDSSASRNDRNRSSIARSSIALAPPPPEFIASQFASNPNSANLWTVAANV